MSLFKLDESDIKSNLYAYYIANLFPNAKPMNDIMNKIGNKKYCEPLKEVAHDIKTKKLNKELSSILKKLK